MKLFLFSKPDPKTATVFPKWLLAVIGFSLLPVCSFNPGGISEQPVCGNNIIEGNEVCDGTDLGGETCLSQDFYGGTLACLADCSGFDTSGCEGYCGDGIINGPEVCDGDDLGGETCDSLGFGGGTLRCKSDCSDFDPSGCETPPECGNNIKEIGEVCDGTDLAGQTCETQGFYEGELACEDDCSAFDTSGCEGYCGDGIKNGPEVCDGDDLDGQTCETQGFHGGELSCGADCSGFNTSNCTQAPLEYMLTVDKIGAGGNIEVDGETVSLIYMADYPEGTVVTVEAVPLDDSMFVEWIGDVTSTEPLIQITMDGEKGVIARFQEKPETPVPTRFVDAGNIVGNASTAPADWRFDVIVLDQNGDPFRNETGLTVTEKTDEGLSDHERILSGHLADSMNDASTDGDGRMTIYYTQFQLEANLGEWERTQNVVYLINGEEMVNAIAITVERLPLDDPAARNIIKAVEALP